MGLVHNMPKMRKPVWSDLPPLLMASLVAYIVVFAGVYSVLSDYSELPCNQGDVSTCTGDTVKDLTLSVTVPLVYLCMFLVMSHAISNMSWYRRRFDRVVPGVGA